MKHLSFSQLGTFYSCKMQYFWKYIKGLVPKRKEDALQLGFLLHVGMEFLYETGDPEKAMEVVQTHIKDIDKTMYKQEDFDDLDWIEIVVRCMINGAYKWFYLDDKEEYTTIETEVKHDMPIINPATKAKSKTFTYQLIADRVVRDKNGLLWLVEYKTASRLGESYFKRLDIDYQITGNLFYLQQVYGEKFAGVIYRIFKKPGIRVKKTETKNDFYVRLEDLFEEESESYFLEQKLYRDQKDIENFGKDVWLATKDVMNTLNAKCFYKNTKNCVVMNCPYISLCSNEFGAEEAYFEKKEER